MPSETDVIGALKRTFSSETFCWLIKPRLNYGGGKSEPDAIFVNLNRNEGFSALKITGFEIKCSRPDWLEELRRPWKSSPTRESCDFWYAVASGPDVIKPEDLPEEWGLLALQNDGSLKTVRTAPRLQPVLMNRDLAMRIIYSALLDNVDQPSSFWKGFCEGVASLSQIRVSPAVTGQQLQAVLNYLIDRKEFQFIATLEEIQARVTKLHEVVSECVQKLPEFKDWETGKRNPAHVEKLVREMVDRNPQVAEYLRQHPADLDRVLRNWSRQFVIGNDLL